MKKISGIIPALITPFNKGGNVDFDSLGQLVEKTLAGGASGFYVTGTSGEAFLLSDAERREVIVKMAERGIAYNVHYKPLPMMTEYKALGFDIKDFPNAYNLFVNEVTLPLHTRLTDEDVEYVIGNFVEIVKSL